VAEGLARESAADDIDGSSKREGVELVDVFILFSFGPVILKNPSAKSILFAIEYILPAHPGSSHIKAADAAEQTCVFKHGIRNK
jgi:hypothetical protein